ncbi:MAG: Flp pilus assembly complex ATPase component TadA [Oscillospiraceae bacterium]|nr:Flp pilus assembly complex ATPase component TadA [Oscillospiraceae bacterium]
MSCKGEYTGFFPQRIKTAVNKIRDGYADKIQELRFRVNRPLGVFINAESRYLTENGELSVIFRDNAITVTQRDIKDIFEAVCQYSVHSFSKELANGFITVQGGHRVGICGTAVSSSFNNSAETIKHISGLNFRVAREVVDCSCEIYDGVFKSGLSSLLIAGSPSSGKTTLLRDLCRRLGRKYKVSIIDERGEIAAVQNGIPHHDIGINSDVFDGYGKNAGIETAVRVMSPQVIICDEIGNAQDAAALERAAVCGVKIIASAHADDMADIMRKNFNPALFDYIALLGEPGKVNEIIRTGHIDEVNRVRFNHYSHSENRSLLLGKP